MAFRYDIGALRPARRTSDGRLRVDGYLTRSGVFTYRNPDGTIRKEYRPPEEVFKQDSLDSFAMAPVTDDHPPELLNPSNTRKYAVGSVGESVRKDGEHVAASMVIFDEDTIKKVESGKRQLSCGYEVKIINEPGVTPEGERYDVLQRNIVGNHVALVDFARAGSQARVRMDSAIMVVEENNPRNMRTNEDPMANSVKVRIDGVEYDASEQVAQAVAKRDDAHAQEIKEMKSRLDKAEEEAAKEKARADSAVKDLEKEKSARTDAEDPAKIANLVKERVALITLAVPHLDSDTDPSTMSDKDIKIMVVKKLDGDDIDKDAHEAYVQGRFDAAIKRADASSKALGDARRVGTLIPPTSRVDAAAARQQFIEDQNNAWKKKEAN